MKAEHSSGWVRGSMWPLPDKIFICAPDNLANFSPCIFASRISSCSPNKIFVGTSNSFSRPTRSGADESANTRSSDVFIKALEARAKSPPPLMEKFSLTGSGANAISGIALVGALILSTDSNLQTAIAFLAVTFASINVFGGYLVTNRMLKMFKKK